MITKTDLNAIPGVTLKENVDVNLGTVVMCKVYACPECGYIELYWPKEKAAEYHQKHTKAVADAAKKAAAETPAAIATTPPPA